MKYREIVEYVVASFEPIKLATAEVSIEQCVDEAIRWWDRVGGYPQSEQVLYPQTNAFLLPERVDVVTNVYTDRITTELFTAQTLLLGVTILDYDIMTLAMKQDHLANLRSFLASRFRWKFLKPYLYVDGMVTAVSTMVVTYLPHFDWTSKTTEITGKNLDWIQRYARALLKGREGEIRRLGSVIQSPLDGDTLVQESKDEVAVIKQEWNAAKPVIPFARTN